MGMTAWEEAEEEDNCWNLLKGWKVAEEEDWEEGSSNPPDEEEESEDPTLGMNLAVWKASASEVTWEEEALEGLCWSTLRAEESAEELTSDSKSSSKTDSVTTEDSVGTRGWRCLELDWEGWEEEEGTAPTRRPKANLEEPLLDSLSSDSKSSEMSSVMTSDFLDRGD